MVDVVFEVSSEAGRKVGGIYTVLRSKSSEMVKRFGDNYYLVGFFDPHSAGEQFREEAPPQDFQQVFRMLEKEGIKCHYGRWMLGSNAQIILVDAWNFGSKLVENSHGELKVDKQINAIKGKLWADFGVDSLFEAWDFNENVCWAYACGRLICRLLELERFRGRQAVAHFHEWIAGAGLLYLKKAGVKCGLVFTTHATTLGRSKVSANENLMREVAECLAGKKCVPVQEAYDHKVAGRYLLEKAAASNAHVFTTVSEIVGKEAEYILGRKPDCITPNALDFSAYPQVSALRERHVICRHELQKLFKAAFLPYYSIRTGDAFITYIVTRYEFENKGIDLYIRALALLNRRLKGSKKPVFALISVPSSVSGPNHVLEDNLLKIDRIKTILNEELKQNIGIMEYLDNKENERENFDVYFKVDSLRKSLRKTGAEPPLSCFDLSYDGDLILSKLREAGLLNREDDPVKVLFYPTYLSPGDGLLNMEYEEVINGADMGVFPSRYEPWGYTPVEAAAMLTLAVTSNLAGFGIYISQKFGNTKGRGIFVADLTREVEAFRIDEAKCDGCGFCVGQGKGAVELVNGKARIVNENLREVLRILAGKCPQKALLTVKRPATEESVAQIAGNIESALALSQKSLERLKEDAREMAESCSWSEMVQNYLSAYDIAYRRAC